MRIRARVLWPVMLLVILASRASSSDLALVDAVRHQDHDAVRRLLQQKVDVNAPQPDGATALHWAAYRDDLDTADLLIRSGARANVANELGVTPLYLAAENRNAAL